MVNRQADGWPGSAGGAPADRIHHHQHLAAAGAKKPVEISRSSGLFHAVLSEVRAHMRNELFRVGHSLILPTEAKCARNAAAGPPTVPKPAKGMPPVAPRLPTLRPWHPPRPMCCHPAAPARPKPGVRREACSQIGGISRYCRQLEAAGTEELPP